MTTKSFHYTFLFSSVKTLYYNRYYHCILKSHPKMAFNRLQTKSNTPDLVLPPHSPAGTFAHRLLSPLPVLSLSRQVLLLGRTMIGPASSPYVDRFACDWHRLSTTARVMALYHTRWTLRHRYTDTKQPFAPYGTKGCNFLFCIIDHARFSDNDDLNLSGIFQFRFDSFRHVMAENNTNRLRSAFQA